MDYIRFAINNPVKVTVGVLLIVMFGMLAFAAIPVQLTPTVDQPIITIDTNWTGRSPEEVEREIIEEQEDKLKSVGGLKQLTATAYEGQSVVSLEFYVGTDMKEAVREVSDKLREVPEYPDEVDEPVITVSASTSETPIAWTVLTADDPEFPIESLRDLAEDRIKPYLERVDGLEEVKVYGGREREVHVQIDPQRMAERGITFTQLQDALRKANVNTSAGNVAEGKIDVRVRTVGEYDDLQKITDTIIVYTEGGPVRVGDIAKVTLTLEKIRGFVRSKGRRALALPAYREVGSNVMRVMEDFRQRLDEVKQDILPALELQVQREMGLPQPPKLNYEQVYDETIYIEDAVSLVQSNLVIGGMLAVAILLLFIRDVRFWPLLVVGFVFLVVALAMSFNYAGTAVWAIGIVGFICVLLASPSTLIIAIAIPVSVVGTFVAMTAAGRSINVISLAGLAFSVGMVVDAAIVVLENIDRHLAMGKPPAKAAYAGAKEVWGAIIASASTTLAVFIPVLFIEEESGQLFRDIALAICAAVTLSLVVSVTVIPSAAAFALHERRRPRNRFYAFARSLFGVATVLDWLVVRFSGLIHWISRPRADFVLIRVTLIAFITIGSIWGATRLMPPTTYLPAGNKNLVFGFIMTPPGYTKEHDNTIGQRVESVIKPYWDTTYEEIEKLPPLFNPQTGEQIERIPPLENFFFVSIFRGMFTGAVSADKENVKPVAPLLNKAIADIPGAFGFASQASLFSRGLGGNNRIDVEVTGFDMGDIRESAGSLFGALMQNGYQVRPNPTNFNLPSPEYRVEIDRIRAADLGIREADLGLGVQAVIDGKNVGDFRFGGKSIDIMMVRDPAYDVGVESLEMIPLAARPEPGTTAVVPVGAVANFRWTDAPQTIYRIEEQRAVTLEVTPPDDIPLEEAQQQIDGIIGGLRQDGAISPAVDVFQAGSADKLTQVRRQLVGEWHGFNMQSLFSIGFSRMFLALIVVYLLMAALFESFLYPFVIMFSVPLAAVGGFLGLALVHWYDPAQQLDVLTMLGFVILIGVVVNNAILIVHQALNFMRGDADTGDGRALDRREALRQSVRTRVRPVLMTMMTSVFGMAPLVLMPGAGSELYRGLGSVVVGGLLVSTFFTLLLVPLVFSLVLDIKAGVLWAIGRGGRRLEAAKPAMP